LEGLIQQEKKSAVGMYTVGLEVLAILVCQKRR